MYYFTGHWAFPNVTTNQTVLNNTRVFSFLFFLRLKKQSSCRDSAIIGSLFSGCLSLCTYSRKITDPVLLCSEDQKSSHNMTGLSFCYVGLFSGSKYYHSPIVNKKTCLATKRKINANCLFIYFTSTALFAQYVAFGDLILKSQ